MKKEVFFIKIEENEADGAVCQKLEKAVKEKDLLNFIEPKDMVAVKTHFGEEGTTGYVRPLYFRALGELLKAKGGQPFLTETSTLYRGKRTNAAEHIELAYDHGFTFEAVGMPIIMADGLLGDEEARVEIPGKIYKDVGIAALFARCQAAVMVSHFTGHLLAGFGAALKNMGMGCCTRKGKLIQHSTAKPSIKISKCTGCGECIKWCPADAISPADKKAQIKNAKCIGCGECLAVCRFDAVGFNWGETYENLQHKMVEHALGLAKLKQGKMLYINFLNRISKDCDCMDKSGKTIVPDIGVVLGLDPVAVDTASLDLVEKTAGQALSGLAFDIPFKGQLQYAKELGLGDTDYQLVEVE